MSEDNNQHTIKLLEKANSYLKDPDTIIDPYDMTYVWVSKSAMMLLGDNVVGKRVSMDSKSADGTQDYGRSHLPAAMNTSNVGRRKIIIKTKSNELKELLIDYIIILFENQPYLITKSVR